METALIPNQPLSVMLPVAAILCTLLVLGAVLGSKKRDPTEVLNWTPELFITAKASPCKIAIIGSGMAGASAA
ncbi:hypothetical protein FOL47_008924 [Perkinsus chesapeaki]|uniref:Uncharacterized protein n=1 Tax=Perkinsus chesapeaki TaxID=330153 RepID=A0A7J6LB09_PERCH|nr:hypothetical protein FOL47_008924 [Perkinsus chesapeaki]